MYAVTEEYSKNIAKTVRYTGVNGYVQAKSGTSYHISDDNISANSLVITRKLNSRGDYRPGGVTAAEMSISLLGFGDVADNLNGARIVLFFDLYRTAAMEEYDRVPLGVFFVDGSQIKRKYSTVKLKAYDVMLKFDIAASALTGTMYELLETACAACGVYLAITQEEFEALPNGTMTVTIDTSRIQTWRDFLVYVGLLTGCWCRMKRDSPNELEIVKLTCERDENNIIRVQRSISGDNRFSTDFSDDKVYITKLNTRHNGALVEHTRKISSIGENITMRAQLELAENPLLRDKTADEVVEVLNNIIIQITQCPLRTFSTDFNGDPALDIGDYVQLEGGAIDIKQNSTGSGFENGYIRVFIASQVWRYRGKHRLECKLPALIEANATAATLADGDSEDPIRVAPKSQLEKRIDGLEAQLGGSGTADTAKRLQTSDNYIYAETTDSELRVYNQRGTCVYTMAGQGDLGLSGIKLKACPDNTHGNSSELYLGDYYTYVKAEYDAGVGNTRETRIETAPFALYIYQSEYTRSGSYKRIELHWRLADSGAGAKLLFRSDDSSGNSISHTLAFKTDGLYLNGKKVLTEE